MMRRRRTTARRGFSLVELLAVVLILAVLAGVAIPLYINSRRTAAARACAGNIAAIATAEAAWSVRNGSYSTNIATDLVPGPEGLASVPKCPLDGTSDYLLTKDDTGALTITCPRAADHKLVWDPAPVDPYAKTMAVPSVEHLP